MKPSLRQWHDIVEPYRAESWEECARIARALVDRDPYDLPTRALLASLLRRTHAHALALIQYERLLPLAVGQGDLFRALATQRHLDALQPAESRHPERFHAMQDWFRYLVDVRRESDDAPRGAPDGAALEPSALLQLPGDTFSMIAERAGMRTLDLAPQVLNEPAGLLFVVYFGRVRWCVVTEGETARSESTSEEGDVIYLPPGPAGARRLELEAETPAELLQLDPALAEVRVRPRRAAGHSVVVTPPPGPPASPARAAARPRRPAAANGPIVLHARPARDPLAEPEYANGHDGERRRHARMTVMLETKAVLLGETGSGAAPVGGRILNVSHTGLGVRFPAEELRRGGEVRPESVVRLQISLDGTEAPVGVMGRVAWIELQMQPGADGIVYGHLGLEFVAMPPEARTRLIHLLDSAERSAGPSGETPAAG